MKKINAKKLATVLVEELEGKNQKESEKILHDFVEYLATRRLLSYWREIVRAIDGVWKTKYGVASVLICSASPLSEKTRKTLEKISCGAEIIETVDPELIGGAVVRVDDRIFDGSIAGALNNLKQSLIK